MTAGDASAAIPIHVEGEQDGRFKCGRVRAHDPLLVAFDSLQVASRLSLIRGTCALYPTTPLRRLQSIHSQVAARIPSNQSVHRESECECR